MLAFTCSFAFVHSQLFVLEVMGGKKKTTQCRQALPKYNHLITRMDLPAQNRDLANPRLGLW